MINYTYLKPIDQIEDQDTNFVVIFTDGQQEHLDSVLIPRLDDNNPDLNQLGLNINELVQKVTTKFSSGFF